MKFKTGDILITSPVPKARWEVANPPYTHSGNIRVYVIVLNDGTVPKEKRGPFENNEKVYDYAPDFGPKTPIMEDTRDYLEAITTEQ